MYCDFSQGSYLKKDSKEVLDHTNLYFKTVKRAWGINENCKEVVMNHIYIYM